MSVAQERCSSCSSDTTGSRIRSNPTICSTSSRGSGINSMLVSVIVVLAVITVFLPPGSDAQLFHYSMGWGAGKRSFLPLLHALPSSPSSSSSATSHDLSRGLTSSHHNGVKRQHGSSNLISGGSLRAGYGDMSVDGIVSGARKPSLNNKLEQMLLHPSVHYDYGVCDFRPAVDILIRQLLELEKRRLQQECPNYHMTEEDVRFRETLAEYLHAKASKPSMEDDLEQ